MSESSYQDFDEVLPEEPNGELVQWMEPRPRSFGSSALALAAAGGFALGLATALLAVGAAQLAASDRWPRLTSGLRRQA